MRPPIPATATEVAEEFAKQGYRVWLVGGWVRDALLGRMHTNDLDLATDAPPERTAQILAAWGDANWTTGIEFGTVGAKRGGTSVEVTTFRSETYRDDSRNPTVSFENDLTADLSRRDFTINAMAIELPGVEIVDPFDGLSDLAQRKLRTPLSPEISFSDDPLRMLRALRFASVLGFEVADDVLRAIASMHDRLSIVSRERVREEFSKLMMGQAPSRALLMLTETGLAEEFLPELPALRLEQDPIHRHKDVFTHTLVVLDNVIAAEGRLGEGPDLVLRIAALLHDIGKPKTKQIGPGGVSFHHHEVVGAQMTEVRMRELRFPGDVIADVKELVYLHLRFHTYRLGWTDRAVRRYVRDAGKLLGKLNTLVRADCTTRNERKAKELSRRMDELEARIRDLASKEELSRLRPALDGRQVMAHLGIPPGPSVGEALDYLMEVRLDEGEIAEEEAYRLLDGWWAERRDA